MSTLTPYEISGDLEQQTNPFPPPFVTTVDPVQMPIDNTLDLVVNGSFFTPTTTVTTSVGTVNSITFVSDNELIVNYTSASAPAFVDITVDNGQTATFNGILEVVASTWTDLRLGNTYTHGSAVGQQIRYRTGMSMFQDANGMYFTGSNPWSSWVKMEFLQWTRGQNKTCEWVFTRPTSSMMIGIGSTATNETNTAQYAQAECEAYFQNSTTMWGLYGNNGTVGSAGNQASSTAIGTYAAYKIKFTQDGGAGGVFTLYGLPSANDTDWDDESTVITTITIAGTLNPDELDIMPFIIPRTDTQRFLAVKVED